MLNIFKKKVNKQATEQFYKYLNVEQVDNETRMQLDITNQDIKNWLVAVNKMIQACFKKHPTIIKNYLTGQLWIGGQQIEFALVKDFKEGPHAMRMKAEAEIERLKKEVEDLKEEVRYYAEQEAGSSL